MKICSRCGSENEDYVKFCVHCGKSFDNTDNHFEVVEEPSLIKRYFINLMRKNRSIELLKLNHF